MRTDLSVLLVEDSVIQARVARGLLERAGIRVECCETLAQAVGAVRRTQFDVVLLDLSLPDADGVETIGRVLEVADVPIVVLTATDDDDLARGALECGAQDFIIKGDVSRSALVRTLKSAIERHRIRRSLALVSTELQQRNESLQQLHEDKNILVKIANNDLRNPLGQVLFMAEILLTEETLVDDHRESISRIQTSCEIMRRSLDDLLSIIEISADPPSVGSDRVDLVDAVGRIARGAESIAMERRAPLQIEPGVPEAFVGANAAALDHALDNFILHMVKISDPDTTLLLRVTTSEGDGRLDIDCTTDSALADHVEQMLGFGGKESLPRRDFGLGIAVGRRLMQQQGGRVLATRSAPGSICLSVVLPLRAEEPAPSAIEQRA